MAPSPKLVVLVLAAVLSVGMWSPVADAVAADAPIRLKAATFTPARGGGPAIAPGLRRSGYAEGQRGYYLVQFRGPVAARETGELASLGATLLSYVPEFAFKVRMTPAQARRAAALERVAWVGLFHPAYKLSPRAARRAGGGLYTVRVERGADAGAAAAAIAGTGARVLSQHGSALVVAAQHSQVEAIARVLDVGWVEDLRLPEKHNEFGGGAIMRSAIANGLGYDGSTQTVAVADTGLGGGTPATAHADIPSGRIAQILNRPGASDACWTISDDGAQDVDSGHGTHVAGSAVGAGAGDGAGRGTAPAARLVFQATENWATMKAPCAAFSDGYYLTGIPFDLRPFFQQAYDAGARIHSNSWGSDALGDYTADSAAVDDFVADHPDLTVAFSAGNEGVDGNADGVIDPDSMGSPATAKNAVTVGASENDRQGNWQCDTGLAYSEGSGTCGSQNGQNVLPPWGTSWPSDYPAEPLKSDPAAGDAEQMAAFSSRGPTDDGRVKPDVVAPGTWILSAYSDLHQRGYDALANPRNGQFQFDGYGFPLSQRHKYMSGTSMANPLVAGGAAVVRDYFAKARQHDASAALVKAALINSAQDLLDENNDGADDNDHPIPNHHEGWGRVDLERAVDPDQQFVDDAAGIATGATTTRSFTFRAGEPVTISLVWSDEASTAAALTNLVNDLDLEVTAPDGTVYRGNVFSGGWSTSGGAADRVNNVENVYVPAPPAGRWTVAVRGHNVPLGSQPFALVARGALDRTPPQIDVALAPGAPDGQNGWYRQDVSVDWSVADDTPAETSGCDDTTVAADTALLELRCDATSEGGSASRAVAIRRDTAAPALAIALTPAEPAVGQAATASPNATDATSGVASASCGTPDTSTAGSRTLSCTATDAAGNTVTGQLAYTVKAAAPPAGQGFTLPRISITRVRALRDGRLRLTVPADRAVTATAAVRLATRRTLRSRPAALAPARRRTLTLTGTRAARSWLLRTRARRTLGVTVRFTFRGTRQTVTKRIRIARAPR